MVSNEVAARRKVRAYDLSEVHDRASKELVCFAGTRVANNVDELGMELADVCECLLQLTEQHFQESIQYEGIASWHDVYYINVTVPSGDAFDMYVKFKMFGERLVLSLCSFHPHGWTS